MHVKVKIGLLREAITQASYTLDSKATSVGSWLYLIAKAPGKLNKEPTLYLYSTNLGLARTLLKLPAEVLDEGAVLIPPRLLQSSLFNLPEDEDIELNLSASGAKLQVKYASIKTEIAVHAESKKAGEVLSTIPFDAKSSFTVSAATLVEIIDRTLFCTASGTSAISEGPWLSSIRMETRNGSIVGIATNKVIAGQAEIHDGLVASINTFALHRDALGALKAILTKRQEEEVTVSNETNMSSGSSNEILFRFSDVILGIRTLSSSYPSVVEKIFTVPDNYNSVTCNREIFLSVLTRLSAFAEKNMFTISIALDKMTIYTKGYSSVFQEQIAKKEKTNSTITIGLGLDDIIHILSVMRSEDVLIQYGADEDHVYFQEGDSNFKYVVSPVMIAWETKGKAA